MFFFSFLLLLLLSHDNDHARYFHVSQSRVSASQERVQDLLDVQTFAAGVSHALEQEEDYERGCGYMKRFLAMDQELLKHAAEGKSSNYWCLISCELSPIFFFFFFENERLDSCQIRKKLHLDRRSSCGESERSRKVSTFDQDAELFCSLNL